MVTESNYDKNKRIAGNTIMLFFRMFLIIFIGLFTSRVILQTLGESDYGTFNAVGGVIAFCSLMTGSVSAAIMRFLTFSLGEGNPEKVHRVFSSSVIIQIFMCVVIGIIVETVGLWWLNSHMVIPDGRLSAAHWVLHCSLGIMAINLLSAPYNAMILSHEKMSAYAFVSILEAVLKLEGIFSAARELGLARLYYSDSFLPDSLTHEEKNLYRAIASKNLVNVDVVNEGRAIFDAVRLIDSKPKPDVPMIMFISDGKETKGSDWVGNHYDYAEELTNAKVIELGCGHYVHYFEPERIASEIRAFIDCEL